MSVCFFFLRWRCWAIPDGCHHTIPKLLFDLCHGNLNMFAACSPPVDLQQAGYWGVRNIQTWAAGEFSESVSVYVATVSISWSVVLSTARDVWTKQPLLCEMQVITVWRETTSGTRQRRSNAVNVTLYHGTMLSRVDFNDLTWNVLCTEEE